MLNHKKEIAVERKKNSESGIALIMVLGVLAVLLILAVTFAFNMRVEQQAARNYLDYVSADYFAKAGIERAIAELLAQSGDGFYHAGSTAGMDLSGTFQTAEGIELGGFAVTIEDESGKINLNHAGNLSAAGSHGANEGWTGHEISIADFLDAAGVSGFVNKAGDIVEYRYGWGNLDAGDNDYIADINADGIDNDGSGDAADSKDPLWFTPWKPRIGHQQFIAASHIYRAAELASTPWNDEWDNTFWPSVRDRVTVHSRAGEGRVNINAVPDAEALYDEMSGILSQGTRAQKVVNIIDYRDKNDWVTEFEYVPGERVYGVESILINEVLAYSYEDYPGFGLFVDYDNQSAGPEPVDENLPPLKAFRVRVHFDYSPDPDLPESVSIVVHGDEVYAPDAFPPVPWVTTDPVISSSGGALSIGLEMTPDTEDSTVEITGVELICAEFIELINIGGETINVDGWTIEINASSAVISGEVEPGDYLVLTNDIALFEASYGTDLNVVEVPGWSSYPDLGANDPLADATNFPGRGEDNIYVYIDEGLGRIADLAIEGNNISRPGNDGTSIGVSREKNDPAVRNDWGNNQDSGATPGEDNSRVDYGDITENILAGLRGEGGLSHPPLVANKHFATVGELFRTYDWRPGLENDVKYSGVRSHARAWEGLGEHQAFSDTAVDRLIAGYYIRVDQSPGTVRLDRSQGRMTYNVYSFHAEDEQGGAFIAELEADGINSDGDVPYTIPLDEYLLLFPDSIPGRINVNTARVSVLSGLPGFSVDFAGTTLAGRVFQDRLDNGHFTGMSNFVGRLEDIFEGLDPTPEEAEISAKRHFAPVANIITIDSDVFRVTSTGYTLGPGGAESATKTLEAIVDRGAGRARVLSLKVVD